MSADLFSPADIANWMQRLNASPRFRAAAGDWVGRLLLVEDDGAEVSRRTWVHVGDGRCLEARVGAERDEETADFVLSASATAWSDLIAARTTPAMAAMKGQLHLLKGNVLSLIPHAKAAAELLAAAADGEV